MAPILQQTAGSKTMGKEGKMRMATCLVWLLVVSAMLCVLAAPRVAQGVPELINYQGELMDSAGNPLNGTVSIVFKICNQQTGGTTLWQETHNTVQVREGIFSVLLGSVTPFPATLFEGDPRWLGIKVGSDAEMTPRSRIASVGYAIRAEKAAEAATATYAATAGSAPADEDWDVSGPNVYVTTGNVGIGTPSPTAPLHVYKNTGNANATVEADSGNAVLELDGADTYVSFERYGSYKGAIGYRTAGDYLYLNKGGYVVVKDGKLGVGEENPQTRLDVSGEVRLWNKITAHPLSQGLELTDNDGKTRVKIRDDAVEVVIDQLGNAGLKVTTNGNVGIRTNSPNYPLHVRNPRGDRDTKIETDSGEAHLILDGSGGNQTVEFQKNGVFCGSVGYDTTGGFLFLWEDGKTVLKDGKLGVGTNNPTETLEVNGSVKVTGRCYGTFPRPAYDSGWVNLDRGEVTTLTHNLGGNVDNYVVDMMFKDSGTEYGINIFGYGGDQYRPTLDIILTGAYYFNLTSTKISLQRRSDDAAADYARVRIWTYN